jgi:gluconolactonase
VWVLNRLAEPEVVLQGPRGASITNVAFGADRHVLYCTDSTHGEVLMARMAVPGRKVATGGLR